jgi:Helix-turn-helix domain
LEQEVAEEKFYTPQEVAEVLKISVDTVRRRFRSEPGVVTFGDKHKTIRIPQAVLERAKQKRGLDADRV